MHIYYSNMFHKNKHTSRKVRRSSVVSIATRYGLNGRGIEADPNGQAVEGEGLQPITCKDYRFESRQGHGCFCCVLYVQTQKGNMQDNHDKETSTVEVQSTRE